IADRIVARLRGSGRRTKSGFAEFVERNAPDLTQGTRHVDFAEVLDGARRGNYSYRWRSGGCAWGHNVIEGAATPAPSKIIPSRFVDILDAEIPDEKYFLTANAAAGIVRRADSVGRTLFGPMRAALEKMTVADHNMQLGDDS